MLSQIPNILTACRLLLIFPFVFFLYRGNFTWALLVYVVAGITDSLDGWIARHFQWQTKLGSFIDPLADKLLITLSFIALALLKSLPWWLVILVFLRDFTISLGVIVWYYLVRNPLEFKPTLLSKINTGFQLLLVTTCLFQLAFPNYLSLSLTNFLIVITAMSTTATYGDYVWTWARKAYSIRNVCK